MIKKIIFVALNKPLKHLKAKLCHSSDCALNLPLFLFIGHAIARTWLPYQVAKTPHQPLMENETLLFKTLTLRRILYKQKMDKHIVDSRWPPCFDRRYKDGQGSLYKSEVRLKMLDTQVLMWETESISWKWISGFQSALLCVCVCMYERDYSTWHLKDKLWTVQTRLGACVSVSKCVLVRLMMMRQ